MRVYAVSLLLVHESLLMLNMCIFVLMSSEFCYIIDYGLLIFFVLLALVDVHSEFE